MGTHLCWRDGADAGVPPVHEELADGLILLEGLCATRDETTALLEDRCSSLH